MADVADLMEETKERLTTDQQGASDRKILNPDRTFPLETVFKVNQNL